MSYYLGNTANTALNLTGVNSSINPILTGFANRSDVAEGNITASPSASIRNVNMNNISGYNTLIFGTKLGGYADGFKIQSVSFQTGGGTGVNETVPEPGTIAIVGVGLIGLGYWRRKSA